MLLEVIKMSEEVPFKSLKITLSDEALDKLFKLRVNSAMRSDSATIEECIRTFSDITEDLYNVMDNAAREALSSNNSTLKKLSVEQEANLFEKIALRAARFVPKSDALKTFYEKHPR